MGWDEWFLDHVLDISSRLSEQFHSPCGPTIDSTKLGSFWTYDTGMQRCLQPRLVTLWSLHCFTKVVNGKFEMKTGPDLVHAPTVPFSVFKRQVYLVKTVPKVLHDFPIFNDSLLFD